MPTAYSYTRFSSLQQSHGRSEERQADMAEPWCQANGYTLDTTIRLRDRGKSAYHGMNFSNGDLGAFLKLIEQGLVPKGSVLLIEHTDRFTRVNHVRGMELINDVLRYGVDIVTLTDGQRFSYEGITKNVMMSIQLTIQLNQNFMESDKKSKRLADVWNAKRVKAQKKEKITSRVPSWLEGSTLEPIPEKVETIRRIFEMARDGVGPSVIAKTLNADKTPLLDYGKKWSSNLVRYFLTTRLVMGELQMKRVIEGIEKPEGEPIAGYYPGVISEGLFYQVQAIMDSRRKLVGRIDSTKNLFTGLVKSLLGGGLPPVFWSTPNGRPLGRAKYYHM